MDEEESTTDEQSTAREFSRDTTQLQRQKQGHPMPADPTPPMLSDTELGTGQQAAAGRANEQERRSLSQSSSGPNSGASGGAETSPTNAAKQALRIAAAAAGPATSAEAAGLDIAMAMTKGSFNLKKLFDGAGMTNPVTAIVVLMKNNYMIVAGNLLKGKYFPGQPLSKFELGATLLGDALLATFLLIISLVLLMLTSPCTLADNVQTNGWSVIEKLGLAGFQAHCWVKGVIGVPAP